MAPSALHQNDKDKEEILLTLKGVAIDATCINIGRLERT